MKSRLVAYGRIQKGRPDRCRLVLLDERLISGRKQQCRRFAPEAGQGGGRVPLDLVKR